MYMFATFFGDQHYHTQNTIMQKCFWDIDIIVSSTKYFRNKIIKVQFTQ